MLQNKYKADVKLKNLIESSSSLGHRSLLFLYDSMDLNEHVGEQVMIIHHLIAKASSERPSILWCHKKGSTTPKEKKSVLKKLEKNIKSGGCDISAENAFHIFLLTTQVTFCEFAQAQSILGKTFGMCVIQDFEALTANNLCRITETVSGGGTVVFILPKEVTGLRELFRYKMDVHNKLKTYSHPDVTPRFNERFVLSLAWCKSSLILDNDLQVRSELVKKKSTKTLNQLSETSPGSEVDEKLKELMESVADADKPLPQLAKLCCTMDQAKAVLKMIDVVTDKSGRSTVCVTAARGRGKSAAIGLGTAAAIFFGVNNIFVTSPSPENLTTYFEFLFKGFDALDYQEETHYDIIQSTNPEFKKAIVRVNVFARHRQIIQYVCPADHQKVSQAELVVIDEAAAIPLTHVQALLGNHNVFMASTINGYEGTGRSLSLKLLKQLRQQTVPKGSTASSSTDESNAAFTNCRPLHEITLETSIRYRPGDPVESWLNRLLCLDATGFVPPISLCPHSDTCDLYYVNRNMLLSGHPSTESFLLQIMSLLVSSHYKNAPDDLHAFADSQAHHLFVLVSQMAQGKESAGMPPVFAVVQVSEEGSIPAKVSGPMLERGESPDGDLIPWALATNFFNPKLTRLKGLRIMRVATHPDYQSMGYGSRAIKLVKQYYEKRFVDLDKEDGGVPLGDKDAPGEINGSQASTLIVPRSSDEPLLVKLEERIPEHIDYIGVSFGVTEPLFKFWKKAQFLPIHVSQSTNQITGEHNCIMVYPITGLPDQLSEPSDSTISGFADTNLNSTESRLPKWLRQPADKFFTRFLSLLGGSFSQMSQSLVFKIISSHFDYLQPQELTWSELKHHITSHDLKRLGSYVKYHTERHLITDLLPTMASIYFRRKLSSVHLATLQSELLIGCGLQYHPIDSLSSPDRPIASVLGQFKRAVERIFNALTQAQEKEVAGLLPKELSDGHTFTPVTISLEQDLLETAEEYTESLKARQEFSRDFLKDLKQYTVKGTEEDWKEALKNSGETVAPGVSIKSMKRGSRMTEAELEKELADPNKKKIKITKSMKRKEKYGY